MQENENNETQDTKGIRVFVYGTLKQGHCNNVALENAEFLGRCYIEGPYRFVDLGWYPAAIDAADPTETMKIFGEVYRVDEDTLYTLDIIEGHPGYYKRRKVQTPWKNAWVYFLPREYNERSDLVDVENGLWEPNEEEQEFARGTQG